MTKDIKYAQNGGKMDIKDFSQMNGRHIDALEEIGNIGAGNAATSLSQMLNCVIKISVPDVKILNYEQAAKEIAGTEDVAGVSIDIKGNLNGTMTTILQKSFINQLLKPFLGIEVDDINQLGDMPKSALSEVANITTASYVNALSKLAHLVIDIHPPKIKVGKTVNILKECAMNFKNINKEVVLIKECFVIKEVTYESGMILMLEVESLNKLMDKLGVE